MNWMGRKARSIVTMLLMACAALMYGPLARAGPTSAPAGDPSQATQSQATTTGEVVNALIDDALAAGERILELPLFVLIGAAAIVVTAAALVLGRVFRKGGRVRLVRSLVVAMAVLAVVAAAFVADRRIVRLQEELRRLRSSTNADATARLNAVPKAPAKRQAFLVDPDEARKNLKAQFGDVTLWPAVCDQATDIVQARIGNPQAQAYLAIVDLRNPAVEVKIGATLDQKSLTSQFARQNACTVAINGEAGMSPRPGSGLGPWRGNMVQLGKVILREDARMPRPFLSFDRQNRGSFISADSAGRVVGADMHNVIWGRLDAIVNGQVRTADERNRQPRTAMAINQDGTRLYLLVVDGRQPGYSMGFTRGEVGSFLKAFGAHNGMLCDEGGSSCIFVKQLGGIINTPSDDEGRERPTYTHFGVVLQQSQ